MSEIWVRNKRSREDTERMILDMAKYGAHSIERREGVRLETDEDVKRFFAECEVDFKILLKIAETRTRTCPSLRIFSTVLGDQL